MYPQPSGYGSQPPGYGSQPPGYGSQPPGYGSQPPPMPSEGGLYPQPGVVGTYNQPPQAQPAMAPYPPPAAPTVPQPQQMMVNAPPPPSYTTATQHTYFQQPTTVTTVQPYPVTNTVVIQQQGPRKPENYMVMAILVTFFCNCPLGVIAWIFSCLSDTSYNEGDHTEARKRGRVAMWLSVAGIIITVLLVIIIPAALTAGVKNHCGYNYHGSYDCYSCAQCMNWYSGSWEKLHCKHTCFK